MLLSGEPLHRALHTGGCSGVGWGLIDIERKPNKALGQDDEMMTPLFKSIYDSTIRIKNEKYINLNLNVSM